MLRLGATHFSLLFALRTSRRAVVVLLGLSPASGCHHAHEDGLEVRVPRAAGPNARTGRTARPPESTTGAVLRAQSAAVAADDAATPCGGRADLACAPGLYCDFGADCRSLEAMGVCRPRPAGCPAERHPVCGCDDVTYPNACHAATAGRSVLHDGECR